MAELTNKQQVVEALRNNNKILLFTHKSPDGDALGSILAMQMALTKLDKEVYAVCNDVTPTVFGFLPEIKKINQDYGGRRDFVLSVDTSKIKPEKIMYKTSNGKLDIIITPKKGKFDKKMVSFSDGGFNSDLVVVLDMPDIERIGPAFDQNSELFYELPVVNIDHHAGNSHFGKINLVDLTATSTSEILVGVFEALAQDAKFIDENIATALLCGIITDTNSFQNANTTPKSLTVAAQLVASGGHQQDIIRNIYKTKPLSTLRLWGKILSNLHDEKDHRFVWSELYKKDFLEVGASETESSGVVDDLLKTASGVDFALLLSEKNGDVHGSLRSTSAATNVQEIAKLFDGGGHPMAAAFQINNTSLLKVSSNIIQKLREYQRDRDHSTKLQADEAAPVMEAE